ncbi:hypothetical protein AAKU55_004165 [Oxalobacteraceae bacterium GrIS 1.11]
MLQIRKIEAIEERLSLAITHIVDRHRSCGEVLTWRLVHEIEDEAFQALEHAGDLDASYLHMFRSSPVLGFGRTDQAADFKKHELLPLAFSIIEEIFYKVH